MYDVNNIGLNFILSTGRTGSTLLSSMLNMHPEILSVSEEPFAYNLFPKYKNITNWTDKIIEEFCYDFYLFSEGKLEPQFGKKEDLIAILQEHKSVLTGENAIKLAYFAFFPNKDKAEVKLIVDKHLKFHYFLTEVAEIYPTAKFIILYRDPRDNVLVKLKRAKKQNKPANLVYFSKTWNYEYHTIIKKIQLLAKERYLEVKYEDLVDTPELVLKKICEFLNLNYNAVMLNYDTHIKQDLEKNQLNIGDTVKKHISLLHEGLTQKVNTDKVGFWKSNFSEAEYNTIWSICEKTATHVGYSKDVCKQVNFFKMEMIFTYLRFYFIKIIIPNTYYNMPFYIKYLIKKIKYGKNFKNGKWATRDFYKTTLPS